MSTNRGIFDSFPEQQQNRQDSPFSVASESGGESAPVSPFSVAARQDSPFSVVDDAAETGSDGAGKSVKIPERRKMDSPFQVAEPPEGFGFEAPAKTPASSPFESTPSQSAPASSPFSSPAQKPSPSPFSAEPQRPAATTPQAAIAAFAEWQEPVAPAPAASSPPVQVPSAFAPSPQSPEPTVTASPAPAIAAPTPAPQSSPAPAAQPQALGSQSDSYNIRQLELRAIFGVDREMNADEILQRSRALPGMRNLARLSSQDMTTVEAVKNLLPSLGFGGGSLKLYSGSVPLEFIREGSVMLAVQTDGGFAPGVRETLMIVARELGRIG